MAAILNLTILDSAILVFPLKLTHTCQDWFPPFTQKNLHSFIVTQLDDGSHLEFYHVGLRKLHSFILTQLDDGSHLEFCHVGFRHLVFFSDSLKNTLTPPLTLTQTNSIWLKLIHSHSTCHLEFCHLGFSHLSLSPQTDSHLPRLVPTICTKETTLTFPSTPFAQKILHSFILTQLDDGSHLEFYHVGLKNFTHSYWLNLMMAAILNSAMLDSDTLFSSLRFTQKHAPSTLTLTQINLIWLKLIHSHLTWWWQPSWILPSWIWPSCFQLP